MTKRARTGSPLLAVAYLRVSTDRQELGPEAQRAQIEAWAAREGVQVVAWHVDAGVSGATPIAGRPALLGALASLRAHRAGRLVVAKRDRLARDARVALSIEAETNLHGARVVTADGTANGSTAADDFMRLMLDGVAGLERRMIGDRTRAALAAKASKGERVGEVPYGFHVAADGIHLERDEAEQAVLTAVRELRAAGMSQRAIARELAAVGLLSRAGKPFGQTQVARMLAKAG